MPGRTTVLANGEIYHIFNRGIVSQPVFIDKRNYDRFLSTLFYYQHINTPIKYSKFLRESIEERDRILEDLRKIGQFRVEIISYCLMPSHFHFLLKQLTENGISKFIGDSVNSYTRYFNTKQKRKGPIFEGKFNSVRIETDEQLLHVSRYIHLNPYTSYLIKTLEDLKHYSYSSFPEFLSLNDSKLVNKEIILSSFKDVESYKQFVYDQADYQRTLSGIHHIILES